jgi:rod shape-determining protein MreD
MRLALYLGLVLGVVPAQATLLGYVSFTGVRPDLCLVAVCLVGFVTGELEGLLIGMALGFVQDLFSAGDLWLNVMTKGAIGLLAGLAGKQVTNATPMTLLVSLVGLSALSGFIFLFSVRAGDGLVEHLLTMQSVLVPETIFNAAVGAGIYWLIAGRIRSDGATDRRPAGLVG